MTNLIFFYGTLMADTGRQEYRSGALARRGYAHKLHDGKVRGELTAIWGGAFPALMPGDGIVEGEVWEMTNVDAALGTCDSIESYRPSDPEHSMYIREEVPLVDDPEGRTVYVYRWNGDTSGLTPIPSGSWRTFVREEEAECALRLLLAAEYASLAEALDDGWGEGEVA